MHNIFIVIKAIFSGFVTGFFVSIPLGPAGFESVKRTISNGYKEGLCVSLGALTADLAYLLLINCGLSQILSRNKETEALFWIISGIILSIIGYLSLKNKTNTSKMAIVKNLPSASLPFLTGFLITFTNPMTPTLWLTLSGTVIRFWYYINKISYYMFLFSLWGGMVAWFALLNFLALKGFKVLTPAANKGTAIALKISILALGLGFVLFGIIKLFL